jgi:RHS repeat-associated protein
VEVGTAQAGLGYTGEWWDDSAGFLYLRARWYDGLTGRFTQVDPWPGDHQQPLTMNPYLYVLANPISHVDPSGEQCTGCRTPGDWAEYTLYYVYGIRLGRAPFLFSESEKLLILEIVEDYSELLGGGDTFKRNLALSKIRMDWGAQDGAFNASYNPRNEIITLPPNWYSPRIAITPNGDAFIMLANPCMEKMLNFPEDSLPTDEIEAKFVLAHEMGHAFCTGNPEALRSFQDNVDLPWSSLAGFSSNPIIARNAGRALKYEVFADVIAAFLYSPDLLNQQMLDWIQNDMPGILQ